MKITKTQLKQLIKEELGGSNEQEYVFVVANADSDPYGDPGRVTIKGIFRTEEEAKRHTSSPVEDEVVKYPLGELFFWP